MARSAHKGGQPTDFQSGLDALRIDNSPGSYRGDAFSKSRDHEFACATVGKTIRMSEKGGSGEGGGGGSLRGGFGGFDGFGGSGKHLALLLLVLQNRVDGFGGFGGCGGFGRDGYPP